MIVVVVVVIVVVVIVIVIVVVVRITQLNITNKRRSIFPLSKIGFSF